ncbi:HPF/RaiA family ribosome-associated protein [Mucilaginibacter sp. CSA2-8R]|jgi:putative sigma-54 modulation protein|uniref:HPF/RaiA family ribosome-associated protein n=1 Tax=Mucilaginibacter sp. CSA2-8R TaxID=3141542 RepID=UPI00315CD262
MKITVHAIHFSADKKLIDFIQKKANKLEQFSDSITSGDVFLRLENTGEEANKITELRLLIKGNQLFASHQCKTFEEGADLAVESLRKQIQKHKQKQNAITDAARKVETGALEEDEY